VSALARWLVIALAVAGVLIDVLCLAGVTRQARLGISTDVAVGMHRDARVMDVVPGSAADRAGIRSGDLIRFAQAVDQAMSAAHLRHAVVRLRMAHGGEMAVALAPVPLPLRSVVLLALGIVLALLAVLVALRAWSDVQARRLSIGFLWLAYIVATVDVAPSYALALGLAADVLIAAGMVALVFFATGWLATPVAVRRTVRRIAVPLAIANGAVSVAGEWSLLPADVGLAVVAFTWVALVALLIVALAISARCARGTERRRIGWILLTMTVSFGPWMVYESLAAVHLARDAWTWMTFTTFALPVGFAYAMLRHRVVDLGFALNRAAVFAATTALLIGLFGALQWGADQVLVQATRAQGFAVQMVIAVVVLYAVRALRAQADLAVARVFFAKRRRRIDAIRALERTIDAVESPAALGIYVADQLRTETAIDAALYVDADDGYVRAGGTSGPERLARDDATVVALRANVAPVPVRPSAERAAATAFPLAVRGRLRGALVCDLPAGDDEFAPDEREALASLAHHACVVREDLLACELRRELDDLRAALVRRATSPLAAE
jgi:hypothetical protein